LGLTPELKQGHASHAYWRKATRSDKTGEELTKNPFAVNIAIGTGELRLYAQRWVEVVLEEESLWDRIGRKPADYTKVLKMWGKVLHAVSTVSTPKRLWTQVWME